MAFRMASRIVSAASSLVRMPCARAMATAAAPAKLQRTALYDLHVELGGKMVPFAGYELPVQYPDGVLKSHAHTRTSASLFDVGHMGQLRWHGKDAAAFLESVCVTDVADLKVGESKLSLLTNERGGIIDDCVITNHGDFIYMVVNGATKMGDLAHLDKMLQPFRNRGADVRLEHQEKQNLIALQGPTAVTALCAILDASVASQVSVMPFMTSKRVQLMGFDDVIITRCGYTGEDGFEISVPAEGITKVARALLAQGGQGGVLPAGLAVRDSLRLEAGLCLYGNDIDEHTSPVEAGLTWTIGKRHRAGGGYPGSDVISAQTKLKNAPKKRVGLSIAGAPARHGAKIYTFQEGNTSPAAANLLGVVTSGTFSPTLKAPIAMGYVAPTHAEVGARVAVDVRGVLQPATIAKMPFVPHAYYKPAAAKKA